MVLRVLLLIIFLGACKSSPPREGPFERGAVLGVNTNEQLEEASGLAASRRYPGFLWTHNDSGHPAELFLIDSLARTVATIRLAGIRNRDWEDIALGPGPDSTTWIYIGDIGDNNSRHEVKIIYGLPEPDPDSPGEIYVSDTLIVHLEGKPRDTEALMVDPLSRNLYLVSKREREGRLYEVKNPFSTDTLEASEVLRLPVTGVVAGDISPDGLEILLKTYTHIYYWKRLPSESVATALAKPPFELSYDQEPQGEAVAWAADGSGFFTLGENAKGERSKLISYRRKKSGAN
ncbi:MAG: hypothetical protein JNL40_14890 [Cyclobacteriaceae bacterium]|nr:hypothetical protein [Cyclobacteriaceae bacterium]